MLLEIVPLRHPHLAVHLDQRLVLQMLRRLHLGNPVSANRRLAKPQLPLQHLPLVNLPNPPRLLGKLRCPSLHSSNQPLVLLGRLVVVPLPRHRLLFRMQLEEWRVGVEGFLLSQGHPPRLVQARWPTMPLCHLGQYLDSPPLEIPQHLPYPCLVRQRLPRALLSGRLQPLELWRNNSLARLLHSGALLLILIPIRQDMCLVLVEARPGHFLTTATW